MKPALRLEELDTPFLWVDLDQLEANIAELAACFQEARVGWRPHFKGLKVPTIVHTAPGCRRDRGDLRRARGGGSAGLDGGDGYPGGQPGRRPAASLVSSSARTCSGCQLGVARSDGLGFREIT